MNNAVENYVWSYSFNRLEETAKTFRRLGEAYESTTEIKQNNGISKQLLLVADVLEECVTLNMQTEELDRECSGDLFRKCFLAGIRIKNASMINNRHGVSQLVVSAKSVGRGCVSTKKLLPVLAQVFNKEFFSVSTNKPTIGNEFGDYIFVEENRFRLLSGVARKGKDCSRFNGDNFLISKLACGKAIAAIADGMGSGKRAFLESRMVIELMENCIDAGFDERAALDFINSAYIAGGKEGVNPVTMDMSIIDCKSGMLSCIKLGAAATFIKRDNMCEIIKSTTLPMGVLNSVDIDCTDKKLYHGDYVVMVSDGLLDNLPVVNKENKMAQIINEIDVKKPTAMAEEIMRRSLKYNNDRPSDDMTVVVLGLFDTIDK